MVLKCNTCEMGVVETLDRQYNIQQARNWQRVAGELNTQALLSSAEQEKLESEIKEQHYRSIAINGERKRLTAALEETRRTREQVRSLRDELARLKNPLLYLKIAILSGLDRLATWSPGKAAALRNFSKRIWWALTLQWDRKLEEAGTTSPANAHGVSKRATEPDPGVVAPGAPPAGPSAPVERDPIPFTCEPHPEGDPLVSVIVLCFNYGRFVREAIASIDMQTFENLEIIAVEGGSTDGTTRETVRSLTGPRLRVLLRDEPHRVGDNRNYGIERARGKYICCLDADDKLHPTYIEKAVFIMEHYGYDVVSSAVQMFGERTRRYRAAEYVDLETITGRNEMSTGAVFRRKYWQMAGGYRDYGDGSASMHLHEDWSLWMRMAAVGARMINFSRDYLFLYRRHGQSSLSGRPGVVPSNEQRAALLEANGDVICEEALQRSKRQRLSSYRATNGLVNVRPQTGDRRKKSIVVALPFMVLGGAERLLSQVFRHLTARGWDVSIVTTIDPGSSAGDTRSWFEEATARIYHLPRFLHESRWEDFIDYLLVARSVSTLWVVGSKFVYHLLPALKRKHPDLRVMDLLFNTVGHTVNNRRYAHLIDRIFVENGEVRAWLLKNGEREERITIISSGVNLTEFRPEAKSQAILKALEIKPSDLVVGFSGRWSPEKDPVGFVHIAALLARRRKVRFIMAGAGSFETEILHALSITPALDGRFHLLENLPDIREVLACFDVLVLPSRLDGRPCAVLEALATGVPVIASRVGGLPELITPGQTGELCAPGDYTAFASAIARLNKDRLLLAQLKRNARRYAEAYLNADDMFRRYESELDKLNNHQPA